MKKICLILFSLVLFATVANAQKSNYHYEDTQARALDMVSKGYVKPLVNEVKVDAAKGRLRCKRPLSNEQVEGMKGDVVNIRAWVVYQATEEWHCDVVVAPTFHLQSVAGGFEIEVVGFAGNFVNWRTMTNEDLEWIRATQPISISEKQIEAVTKPTTTK